MALSITEIARNHADFIRIELEKYEQTLHPSSSEDEELVRRASFAVRNKSVLFERFIPFSETLYTVIQDVRIAEVRVDFRNNTLTCNCRQTEHCRHKVATLLALYQHFASVQEWTTNWRAKKNVQLCSLATERSPENWLLMVDEVMSYLLKDQRRIESYFVPSIVDNAHTKLRRHLPFEREWQPLYQLFMELAVLNKLWSHLIVTQSSLESDYFEYFVEKTHDKITEHATALNQKSRLFATDPFYDALQKILFELLTQEKGLPSQRLSIYLSLWSTVLQDKKRALHELDALTDFSSTTDLSIETLPAIFYIMLKDEKHLESVSQNLTSSNIGEGLAYAQFALNVRDQVAASLLLKAMLPHLEAYLHEHVQPAKRLGYTRKLDQLYAAIELTEDEEIMLYSSFGKYGVRPFSDYLIRQNRFDEWAALHQLYPSSISHLETCGLKTVLQEAPHVTLPIYHYYALEEIRQKSRMNYKQAVRILKSMKSAAKKAGKMTYFQSYMDHIRTTNKRLRAFQEELDKSNLFS